MLVENNTAPTLRLGPGPTQSSRPSRVGQIMSVPLLTVRATELAAEALRVAVRDDVRHLLVADGDVLVGVLSVSDLREATSEQTVAACMSFPVIVVSEDTYLDDAGSIMKDMSIGFLPVAVGESVVGVVTRGDLRRAGLDHEEDLGGRICVSCGELHDVRPHHYMESVYFCIECLCRCGPPEEGDELGRGWSPCP